MKVGRAGETAAAILAGGRGRRLGGATKALLEIEGGGRIVDRQLAVLRPLFGAIAIVAADEAPFRGLPCPADAGGASVDVIRDRQGPGLGPLAGLDAVLTWLPASCRSIVCVAGDMPFLAGAVMERLRDAGPDDAAAVVPRLAGGPEPLCARYDRRVAAIATAQLAAGQRAMHAFLDRLDRDTGAVVWLDEADLRRVDPQLETFININTHEDLRDLERRRPG
ncbi:MAG: molybdenum cofactor guanylyltransferase [Verrucomicrobiota bacterium]